MFILSESGYKKLEKSLDSPVSKHKSIVYNNVKEEHKSYFTADYSEIKYFKTHFSSAKITSKITIETIECRCWMTGKNENDKYKLYVYSPISEAGEYQES